LGKKLGEMLVSEGIVDRQQLDQALERQVSSRVKRRSSRSWAGSSTWGL
jgi:hypothetical protein